jgi:methyl-accepting chemotaxis protein
MDNDRTASAIPIIVHSAIVGGSALIAAWAAARGREGLEPGIVLAASIAISALAGMSLLGYVLTIVLPRMRIAENGKRVKEGLAGLSTGIAKLGIGDLAAVIPQLDAVGETAVRGELSALASVIDELRDSIMEAITDFNGITSEPCARLIYVGSDSYLEGRACGEALCRIIGKSGSAGIIVSDLRMVNQNLRRKGFLSVLGERSTGIGELRTVETFRSQERTYEAVRNMLAERPDLSAVYVTEGNTPSSAAKAVIDAGREGKTVVLTHDLTDATMEYIQRGVIAATISQDPYAQGYDAPIRLFNAAAALWKPAIPRQLVKLVAVTRENASAFWTQEGGALSGDRSRLAVPADVRPEEPLRIAVVNFTSSGFWKPVKQGAIDAGKALADRNASVEWIDAEPSGEGGMAASTFAPVIARLVDSGYRCIALPIFDRALIPAVNAACARGVIVATVNSEPVSLREMLTSAADHADRLISLSQGLAASSTESGQATASVGETMPRIAGNLKLQAADVERTGDELSTLSDAVGKADRNASEGAESARRSALASEEGLAAVSGLRNAIVSFEGVSASADGTIKALRQDTARIADIVASIADLSERTNVLAINASIQAARAGKEGKAFAVVAGEIRSLADQTSGMAAGIRGIVENIIRRADEASRATEKGLTQARANAAGAEVSERSLEAINELAQENERRMRTISAAIEGMAESSRGIEGTMRSLSESNQTSDEAVENIDRSMKELSAQAMDVSDAAHNLLEMAQAQLTLLSQFRLRSK